LPRVRRVGSFRRKSDGDGKLLNIRIPQIRNQTLVGAGLFVFAIWAAWLAGNEVISGSLKVLEFIMLGFAAGAIGIAIVRSWRTGFYLFLVWMLFEDLVRKYMGNNLALFFGKDILLLLVYISFFRDVRLGRAKSFRPPFLLFLSLFFWFGLLQVFNQNSPSILYGLLGMKTYFYYIPLTFVAYGLIQSDRDLRKFLIINAILAGVIGGLGIAQAVLGNTFLNPATLAPELQELGNLSKVTPLTGQVFSLPSSIFVSSGRFATYLLAAFILAAGTAAYLILHTRKYRKLVFVVLAVLGVATLLSGSRNASVFVASSALALPAGFLWGAPWLQKQGHRLVTVLRRSFIVGALGLAAVFLIFPEQAGSRLAFYSETLNPDSSAYQGNSRAWNYPMLNLDLAWENPNWLIGNGIGTDSSGAQYVSELTGTRPSYEVEEGYGSLIVEMGILAPILWILWTAALLYYLWKVIQGLRETRLFPIGFAMFWYALLLLYPLTYIALAQYQNYVTNIYLWIFVGIVFRLPQLLPGPLVSGKSRPSEFAVR
jgi:hypothetical protein